MTPPLSLYNLALTFLLVSCSSLSAQPHISTLPNSDEAIVLESPSFRSSPLGVFASSPLGAETPRLLIFVENISGATPASLKVEASDGKDVTELPVESVFYLFTANVSQVSLITDPKVIAHGYLTLTVVFQSQRSNDAWVGFDNTFIIAGQSNASGRGTTLQSNTNSEAFLFGNDYRWKVLRDPVDSIIGQVDSVSNEGNEAGGSVWPLVASEYQGSIAFVPTALGGTRIEQWLPGANHEDRSTLYGSMIYRARRAGKIKAVLWWQGETDAVLGTPKAAYLESLNMIANAIKQDLGVPLIPAKLQRITLTTGTSIINDAIDEAWRMNPNVRRGPDLSVLDAHDQSISSDGVHINTNEGLQAAAKLWVAALP